jgi:hypothetical protein
VLTKGFRALDIAMLYGQNQTHTIDDQTYNGFRIVAKNKTPELKAIIRLPTADEVAKFTSEFQTKNLTDAERAEQSRASSLALFNKLKQHGDNFEADEADIAIARFLEVTITGVEKLDGNLYKITAKTPFGDTVHTMRSFTCREKNQYNAAKLPNVRSLAPSVTYYDALVQGRPEGYAEHYTVNDIPCHHKELVIMAMLIEYDKLDPIQIEFDPNS